MVLHMESFFYHEVPDVLMREQHINTLIWMMQAHASILERKGWQWEPDNIEILEWYH